MNKETIQRIAEQISQAFCYGNPEATKQIVQIVGQELAKESK